MSLPKKPKKIKSFTQKLETIVIFPTLVFGVLSLFLLGQVYSIKNIDENLIYLSGYFDINTLNPDVKIGLVGSKNGSKYYYLWCSGVSRIKEENLIYFDSPEDAIKKGYSRAKNCPGE